MSSQRKTREFDFSTFNSSIDLSSCDEISILSWHFDFVRNSARKSWDFLSPQWEFRSLGSPEEYRVQGTDVEAFFLGSKRHTELIIVWAKDHVSDEIVFSWMSPASDSWYQPNQTISFPQFRRELFFTGEGLNDLRQVLVDR